MNKERPKWIEFVKFWLSPLIKCEHSRYSIARKLHYGHLINIKRHCSLCAGILHRWTKSVNRKEIEKTMKKLLSSASLSKASILTCEESLKSNKAWSSFTLVSKTVEKCRPVRFQFIAAITFKNKWTVKASRTLLAVMSFTFYGAPFPNVLLSHRFLSTLRHFMEGRFYGAHSLALWCSFIVGMMIKLIKNDGNW